MLLRITYFLFFQLTICYVFAQDLSVEIPSYDNQTKVTDLFQVIEAQYPVKIYYKSDWFEDIKVSTDFKGQNLEQLFIRLSEIQGLEYLLMDGYAIVFVRDDSRQYFLEKNANELYPTIVIGEKSVGFDDSEYPISGQITTDEGEPLFANLTIHDLRRNMQTDSAGRYSFSVKKGKYMVSFQAAEYKRETVFLEVYDGGTYNVELEKEPIMLEEVVIQEKAAESNFESSVAGRTELNIEQISELPTFLGEVDIVKSIQTLPGITNSGEGSAGFNVRGGGVDQNLVLWDNLPVLNPNHVFGFFSAFHPDATQGVTFYRGAIPASYGGRVSSVMDITQKKGDMEEYNGSGGIGLISTRFELDGPIIEDRLSFLIAGRASYNTLILRQFNNLNVRNSEADFYDLTSKLSYKYDKGEIRVSGYYSGDNFSLNSDTTFGWNNYGVIANHFHSFNNVMDTETNIGYGGYSYKVNSEKPQNEFSWDYNLSFVKMASRINRQIRSNLISIGVEAFLYDLDNGELKPEGNSTVQPIRLDKSRGLESAAFLHFDFQVTPKLTGMAGLRYSMFHQLGPYQQYVYSQEGPTSEEILDSVNFKTNETVITYSGWEPRFSLKYEINDISSLKAGISRNFQYLHLISNNTSITPTDIWSLSSPFIRPQIGIQYSLGYNRKISDIKSNILIEGFYKELDNVLEYKNGADLILQPNIETEVLPGEGYAYGVEFSLNKYSGDLKGSLNYTFSRTFRKAESSVEAFELNEGDWFPANFDRPHNLFINANYAFTRKYSLVANFTWISGRPYTTPTAFYTVDNVNVFSFEERNNDRLPNYHRLDLSFIIKPNHKKNKVIESSWTFTIFNLYARDNTNSIFYTTNEDQLLIANSLIVLGSVFPSVTYNFKF